MALSTVQQIDLNTATALESVAAALNTSSAPGTLAAGTSALRGADRLRRGGSPATFADIRRWVIRELVGPGLAHNPDDTSVDQARAGFAALIEVIDVNNEIARAVSQALRARQTQSRDSIGEQRTQADGPNIDGGPGKRTQTPTKDTRKSHGTSPVTTAGHLDGVVDVLATQGIEVNTYGRPPEQARSLARALSEAGEKNLDPSTLGVLRRYADQLSTSYGDHNIKEALESGVARREQRQRRITMAPPPGPGGQDRHATRAPITR